MARKLTSIFLIIITALSMAVTPINVNAATKAKSLSIKRTLTMKKGSKKTLKVTIKPKNVTVKKLKWKSSNTKIATVNSKGKVTAKKSGIVKITAATIDGSKRKATCTVYVLNKKTKASVKYALQMLRDYILENGDENRYGQMGIFGEYKYKNSSKSSYGILYNSGRKTFEMFWYDKSYVDDDEEYCIKTFVEIEYSLTGFDYCTASITNNYWDYDEITAGYSVEAIFKTAKYNRDSYYPTIKKEYDTYHFSNQKLNEHARNDLRVAMTDWNDLLKDHGISLSDIGFTKV